MRSLENQKSNKWDRFWPVAHLCDQCAQMSCVEWVISGKRPWDFACYNRFFAAGRTLTKWEISNTFHVEQYLGAAEFGTSFHVEHRQLSTESTRF